ncbi:unnamed protein product [Adineta ricciae]|uniref:Uncharacterized protein n=1 Tax=Adineta ricciae TaxID=249248 RepID=A0A814HTM1_ADIRI|nr:unnamed protein product [Adineta ricciae]CAF1636097.1 unnamed protein product [Adineta ricciae]
MTTNNRGNLHSSDFFTRILLQSGQYTSPPTLESDAEKLLVHFATLFAQQLVSKSSLAATARRTPKPTPINLNDVNFVLKHQWPVYDSSSYNQTLKKSE